MRENFYLIADIKTKIEPNVLILDWEDLKGQNKEAVKRYYGNNQITGFDLVPREPFSVTRTGSINETISALIDQNFYKTAWTVGLIS